jgi:hypothetical protein
LFLCVSLCYSIHITSSDGGYNFKEQFKGINQGTLSIFGPDVIYLARIAQIDSEQLKKKTNKLRFVFTPQIHQSMALLL